MRLSNIPFKLESALARRVMLALGRRPSSAPFVSGDSFRALSDSIFENGVLTTRAAGVAADVPIVFVQSSEVKLFFSVASRLVDRRYILITNNGDENIGAEHLALLDERVVHWFAHNVLVRSPRITAIPIGLENACLYCNGIVADYESLRARQQDAPRAPRVLAAFTVGNNAEERKAALDAVRRCPAGTIMDRTNSRAYRQALAQFMYVASPPGNGFDCHRTWEAFYLGVIPIVKRHAFFENFPDLPFLQLGEWAELKGFTEERLRHEYPRLREKLESSRTLWMDYWIAKIEEVRQEALS
jgi:hypothetical protein